MSDNHTKIKRLIQDHMGIEESVLIPEARLIEDIGMDSLDLVEMVMFIEEDFEFEIPDEDAEKFITLQDVLNYVDKRTVTASTPEPA